jgi:hypothetical protein
MVTPLAYYDLIETFPQSGCAVCRLVLRDVDHFLDSLLYERVMEPDTHKAIRASRGLCNEHGWQLTQYKGGTLGVATLYQAAISEVLKAVEQPGKGMGGRIRDNFRRGDSAGSTVSDSVEPVGECMACHILTDSEHTFVTLFAQKIMDTKMQEGFRASDGLCLPHFQQVARRFRSTEPLQTFVAIQVERWQHLQADLIEFIDKNRAERMNEAMGAESDSGPRAIGLLRGLRGVFGLDGRRK